MSSRDLDEDQTSETKGIVVVRPEHQNKARSLSAVDDKRFVWAVIRQWGVIAGAAILAVLSGHWSMYLAMMFVIATRQHALGILMHDATHFRCLRNKTANDVFSDLFCALPIGMLTSRYRYEHQRHHRFLNTDRDPYWKEFMAESDWHWPKRPMKAASVLVRDLLGLNAPKIFRTVFRWSPWINHFSRKDGPSVPKPIERLTIYGFHAVVATAVAVSGRWLDLLVLWLVPMATIATVLIRVRTIAEHLGLPNETELDASRHTEGTWLERLTLCPFNINYHIDHHLFPQVPWYNLPALHEQLMCDPAYRGRAHINKSYIGGHRALLDEIIVRPRRAAERPNVRSEPGATR